MTVNEIGFNPKWLKAAALIAARRDIRYYLNGVLVEVFEREARLVATDGHRMLILRKLVEGATPARIIIPTEVIDHIKPSPKPAYSKVEAVLQYEPNSFKATLQYFDIGIQFKAIDGKFPDYTQTMNKAAKPSGETAHFNAAYLHDFKRAVTLAFGADRLYSPHIWQNGTEPAGVTYKGYDEFFGIVMPLRDDRYGGVPSWALPLKVEQKQPEEALAA